jgi:hypothetical protein
VFGQQTPAINEDVRTLVGRLDLRTYKSTIESLSQFGDRRQGTRRNRDAVDWIEARLKSYGCSDVERLTYTYVTPRSARTWRVDRLWEGAATGSESRSDEAAGRADPRDEP